MLDQTYCQNQDNSQKTYHKKGIPNIILSPTEKLHISGVGIQAINGNSFIDFLENTKTFSMMQFMVKTTINNIQNNELAYKLTKIIENEDLSIDNILKTVNKHENYKQILITLEDLAPINKSINELYEYVKKNKGSIRTKSKIRLENLQKTMLLSYFYDKKLQYDLIMEKPIAVNLDNYKVHHAIVFKKLCNILNMDLIYLPPYSPKYNTIEQVWRTVKGIISRKYIDNEEDLINEFKEEFYKVVNNPSYWKKWVKEILLDI